MYNVRLVRHVGKTEYNGEDDRIPTPSQPLPVKSVPGSFCTGQSKAVSVNLISVIFLFTSTRVIVYTVIMYYIDIHLEM